MTNENCLEDIRCLNCGNQDRFMITATVVAEVTDDGADLASPEYGNGFEWDDNSPCCCPQCGRNGPLKTFYNLPAPPPDPEGMNDDRAHWAFVALTAFMVETGCDLEDAVADLLCDLKHWCDRHRQDFDQALARAQDHYVAETFSDEPAD